MRLPILLTLLTAAALAQAVDTKLYDALSYRFIGPANMGGRTTDVEGVPGNPAVVYVGTGGGGLWKTTSGGVTWTPLWEREGSFSVGARALDPRNPEVVWLGSGEANMRNSVSFGDGVYKSADGGKSWRHLGLRDTEHIARVIVSPLDSNTAWVCAVGRQAGPNPERGVFLTTDGGASWQKTLYLDDKHGCADLDIDPRNPNIVFAAMWRFQRWPWNHTSGSEQSGIFKSSDGGRTWKKLTNTLPKLIGRAGVKVAPSNPKVVYVACESFEGTLYRSADAGETWTEMTRSRDVVSRGFYYADLRVDPADENRVYAVAGSLLVSIDAGKTFRNASAGTHVDFHSLWIDPQDPKRMWQGQDGGIAVTYDRGDSWEAVTNIPLGQFYQIHADNASPFYNVTGGLQDNGTWRGPARVRQPSGITNAEWLLLSFGDGFYAYSHPDNPDIILSESQGGAILRTDLKSGEAQSISPQPRSGFISQLKYRFNWNTPIIGSPHGKNTVYFGSNVLFQTRDFGRSWEPISPDLTTNNPEKLKPAGGPVWLDNSTAENNNTIISIAEHPSRAGVIWTGTDDGNLHLTTDGGKSWTNVAPNVPGIPPFSSVSHVEPSQTGAATAYASFDAHLLDDYRPHVYKTTDSGKSWTRISGNLPERAYVHIVREDPQNPAVLYAGTELGLYVSYSQGLWQPLWLKNLPRVAVHDIVVHPRENDLILGTHGRSVVILDDAAFVQQMTPEVAAKPAHLFPPRHAWRTAGPMRAYGLGNKAYAAPNPAPSLITYYLKEAADPKIEIFDGAGKLVRTLQNPPKTAGVQRVAWDLRYEAPKPRTPPDPNAAAFGPAGGPAAVPGNYIVRLTAAGLTTEQRLEIRVDPALASSPQDLLAAREASLKVAAMLDPINATLRRLDSLKDQLKNIERIGKEQKPAEAPAWSKQIAALQKEIDAQTATLGLLQGGSRLNDPPGLAEDLASLFTALSRVNSAPTAAQLTLLAELEARYNERLPKVTAALAASLPQWNEALRKLGAPGIL